MGPWELRWLGGPPPRRLAGPEDERQAKLQRLEAVLLLAREPLNSRRLARLANLADGTEARTLTRQLRDGYDRAGRAFRVEEVAGGFQLLTRAKFAPWLRKWRHAPAEERLSAPAMETLAVVAYRQPVTRAEIEAVRGVGCGEILRSLMERDLVRVAGRSDELGRPYLYGTTKRFLRLFGLQNLEQLPRADRLRDRPPPGAGPPAPEPLSCTLDRELQPEETQVSVSLAPPVPPDEALDPSLAPAPGAPRQSVDDEDEFEQYEYDEDEYDEQEEPYDDEEYDEDEEEEYDEDEEDWDEEYDDEDLDEDEEEDEDLEDEPWEEVEDEEEDEEEQWEEDEDWGDEDEEEEDEWD